jgi:CubicO group peptidase (beta-lactamase class C family)
MVKVGAMMLNRGMWNGQRIISEEWVLKCSKPHRNNYGIKVPGEDFGKFGYSYTWWTNKMRYKNDDLNMFMGLGWGGQKIIVFPEINTVVVFTGAIYQSNVKHNKILMRYILPALQ